MHFIIIFMDELFSFKVSQHGENVIFFSEVMFSVILTGLLSKILKSNVVYFQVEII